MRIDEIENKEQLDENQVYETSKIILDGDITNSSIKYNLKGENLEYNFEIDMQYIFSEFKEELDSLPQEAFREIVNYVNPPRDRNIDTSQVETIIKGLIDGFTMKKIKEIEPTKEGIQEIINKYK